MRIPLHTSEILFEMTRNGKTWNTPVPPHVVELHQVDAASQIGGPLPGQLQSRITSDNVNVKTQNHNIPKGSQINVCTVCTSGTWF